MYKDKINYFNESLLNKVDEIELLKMEIDNELKEIVELDLESLEKEIIY